MNIAGLDSSISNDANSGSGNINELVERWNHSAKVSGTCDRENYINRDIKFLYEYSGIRNLGISALLPVHGRDVPRYVPVALAEAAINQPPGKVRDLLNEHITRYFCVVSGWDQKLVLVDDVKLMDEIEEFVPSIITVGFQVEKGLIEGWRDPIGESRLYGFIKPCLGFAEWELQGFTLPISSSDRRHDVPVSMIESRAKVVNNISANERGSIYHGFVSFCESGTLSRICICFDSIGERAFFLEQCVQLVDVFRGPINL